MAKKKRSTAPRPQPHQQDSMRRDIEAAREQNLGLLKDPSSHDDAEGGLDIADELLATLDARDRGSASLGQAAKPTSSNLLAVPQAQAASSSERRGSQTSGKSHTSGGVGSPGSPRGAREKLMHVGEKLFGSSHHSDGSALATSPPAAASPTRDIDGELASDLKKRGSIRRIFGVSPSKDTDAAVMGASTSGKPKVSRQQARLDRRAAEMEQMRLDAELELKANGGKPDEAERERVAMSDYCKSLNVEMKEITPDGHCLYAAIADQLNVLGKAHKLNYQDTRKATAEYMRGHPDDFVPFISDSDESMAGIENNGAGDLSADQTQQQSFFLRYCDAIEKTAVWGGQPEILAMSKAFHTPIHVVQAGNAVVKVGSDELPTEEPVIISYHRHMYGLGEHYNSLRKTKAHK